jgi:hypothetical protein
MHNNLIQSTHKSNSLNLIDTHKSDDHIHTSLMHRYLTREFSLRIRRFVGVVSTSGDEKDVNKVGTW